MASQKHCCSAALVLNNAALLATLLIQPAAAAVPKDFFKRCTPLQVYTIGTTSAAKPTRVVRFNAGQRATIMKTLELMETEGIRDRRMQGYILGTMFRETSGTLRPIREGKSNHLYFLAGENGHAYYGRGYIQLTGIENYRKVGQKLGIDLVTHPEMALDRDIALKIAVRGMAEGWFTRHRLSEYFTDHSSQWYQARATVNPRSPRCAARALPFRNIAYFARTDGRTQVPLSFTTQYSR